MRAAASALALLLILLAPGGLRAEEPPSSRGEAKDTAAPPAAKPARKPRPPRRTEQYARILYSRKSRITGLEWEDLKVPIVIEFGEYQYQPVVTLEGTYERPEWGLVHGEQTLVSTNDLLDPDETGKEVEDPGEFQLKVKLKGRITPVQLTAVGPYGKTERARTYVVVEDWHALEDEIASRQVPREHQLAASLGPTFLTYSQTGRTEYSSILATAKIGYFHRLSLRWDLGFNAFMNVLPLTTSQDGVTAQFLAANLRVGYRLKQVRDPWSLSVLAGAYYFTMIVTDRQFGFRNMMGPQLYPLLMRTFPNGDSGYAYFKFSPVSNGPLNLKNLKSRELGMGLGYALKPGRSRQQLGFSIDYSDLNVDYDNGSANAQSFTLSVSYGLVIR